MTLSPLFPLFCSGDTDYRYIWLWYQVVQQLSHQLYPQLGTITTPLYILYFSILYSHLGVGNKALTIAIAIQYPAELMHNGFTRRL